MRSLKHQARPEFQPFKNPTTKVREAYSRIAGTLCASALAGAMIVAFNEPIGYDTALRVSLQLVAALIGLLISIYSLKGA
jgi:predicted lipid-binding transport protein (Tim44 family)